MLSAMRLGIALTRIAWVVTLGVTVVPLIPSTAGAPINDTPADSAGKSSTGKVSALSVSGDVTVAAFGDASALGDLGSTTTEEPMAGIAPTPSGDGYWLAARDGGIFAFGDAAFHGSTGAIDLNQPVVGIAPTPSGDGYWLVARDGGIFAFGDAGFLGSVAGSINQDVTGISATPSGAGYWLAGDQGAVIAMGDATALGELNSLADDHFVVGIATSGTGGGYWLLSGPIPPPPPPPPPPSPWPSMPTESGEGTGRRIVYSNSMQRIWLVESDEVVWDSWLVSGREGIPAPGTYHVYAKARFTHSRSHPNITMEYMVRFAKTKSGENIGFHTIPLKDGVAMQTEAELGQFRSAGCVRQSIPSAIKLWDWTPVGTPVIVTP